jgi:hypothetical protein
MVDGAVIGKPLQANVRTDFRKNMSLVGCPLRLFLTLTALCNRAQELPREDGEDVHVLAHGHA